jgi:hypothetical protein
MINELLNKILIKIEIKIIDNNDEIYFYLSNGAIYKQFHSQDCCEYVHIEDINGNLDDLIGYPLLQAEESNSDAAKATNSESATWTFYKLATIKGYVTIRWLGSSNGYYSESAQMSKIKDEDPIKVQRRKKLIKMQKNEKFNSNR